MIRRLQVEGWRAFDRLSLELDPGVTFVVAENGIGKTSLIEALSWGLYGDLARVDARGARRFGEGQLRVQVHVELPNGQVLVIDRVQTGRSETLHATVDNQEVDDTAVAQIMATSFGASREFLSRTTVLPSAAVTDNTAGIFELHQHLCHVFGVDDLQAAAAALGRIQAAAEAEAKKHRQDTRRAAQDLTHLRTTLATAEQAVLAAENARAQARIAATAAQAKLEQAHSAHKARLQAEASRRLLEELQVAARPLLAAGDEIESNPGPDNAGQGQQQFPGLANPVPAGDTGPADPAGFRRRLIAAEAANTSQADHYRAELALISAELTAARNAVAQLHNADAECPICRRHLGPDDVATADQAHQQNIAQLTERQVTLQKLLATAGQRVQGLRTLISRTAELPSSPLPIAPGIDIDGAAHDLERARAAEDQRAEQAAEARAERNALQRAISTAEASADEQRQSYVAHRREAAASIAMRAMTDTANLILTERIDPLVTEITHRWKKVFVNRGELRLRHDGRLVLVRGTHEIGFDQLSSGEKVIALLATRLLVLSASTRASFLWLDEPLEHLDPNNRRLAASLMSTAGQHVSQLLITTYEEKLARRLAVTDDVAIRYVRTAG
jgi:DNA repair exonuclease SbcCD ATPase subunit